MKFSPSVLMWGGMIALGLTTALNFAPSGEQLNSGYYIENILKKIVKPAFERDTGDGNVTQWKLFDDNDDGIFQQDGARCHTSAVSL